MSEPVEVDDSQVDQNSPDELWWATNIALACGKLWLLPCPSISSNGAHFSRPWWRGLALHVFSSDPLWSSLNRVNLVQSYCSRCTFLICSGLMLVPISCGDGFIILKKTFYLKAFKIEEKKWKSSGKWSEFGFSLTKVNPLAGQQKDRRKKLRKKLTRPGIRTWTLKLPSW